MSASTTSHAAPEEDWVIQSPKAPAQLIVLLHGAAGTPADMQALGQALATVFTQALILALPAPVQAADGRRAWLLPSEDQDRYELAQVQAVVEGLCARIEGLQGQHGLGPQATALLGFGQGATLVLHSTMQATPPADRVVALSGAFAQPLASLQYGGTVHLLHGKNDAHTHWKTVVEDAYVLRDSGVDMTAEIVPLIGHELHPELVTKTVERLSTHIAKHLFEAAQASAPPDTPGKAH